MILRMRRPQPYVRTGTLRLIVASVWGSLFSVAVLVSLAIERSGLPLLILGGAFVLVLVTYVVLGLIALQERHRPHRSGLLITIRALAIAFSLAGSAVFGPGGIVFYIFAFAIPTILISSVRDE
jgi:hypothetical protein